VQIAGKSAIAIAILLAITRFQFPTGDLWKAGEIRNLLAI
jgi:hypothetical protein